MTNGEGLFLLVLIQILKLILNFKVYNFLHKKNKIDLKPRYSGMYLREDAKGIQSIFDSNIMLIYLFFIFFWIKIPKSIFGKVLAWLVLLFSFIQLWIVYLVDWVI